MTEKKNISENNDKNYYLRDLTPEEYARLPFAGRYQYVELIKEFRNLGKYIQKVELGSVPFMRMYIGLRTTIDRLHITDIEVRSRKGEIFLRKRETIEQPS
jgi:hypothetical protein